MANKVLQTTAWIGDEYNRAITTLKKEYSESNIINAGLVLLIEALKELTGQDEVDEVMMAILRKEEILEKKNILANEPYTKYRAHVEKAVIEKLKEEAIEKILLKQALQPNIIGNATESREIQKTDYQEPQEEAKEVPKIVEDVKPKKPDPFKGFDAKGWN